jgi:hypothetical protein
VRDDLRAAEDPTPGSGVGRTAITRRPASGGPPGGDLGRRPNRDVFAKRPACPSGDRRGRRHACGRSSLLAVVTSPSPCDSRECAVPKELHLEASTSKRG